MRWKGNPTHPTSATLTGMSANRRPQRALVALGGLVLVVLLAVGIVQLTRSAQTPLPPSGLTVAQMQSAAIAPRPAISCSALGAGLR